MELELEQERIIGYELAGEKTVCQEETLESIVPDACPDILRIADVCGHPIITGKQPREDAALVSGTVPMSVLYEPEGKAGLCKMDVSLPFTCQLAVPGLTDSGRIIASASLRHAEAKLLNPRKVLLRVDLAVNLRVYRSYERAVCCAVCSDREATLCQKKAEVQDCYICDVAEKPFRLETQLRMKAVQGEQVQILSLRGVPVCSDCKLIGNKLIFKGSINLAVLTQDSGRLLNTVRESVPFSQIMEVNGGEGGQSWGVTLELQSLEWSADTDDSGLLSVTADILAQTSVMQSKTLTLLEDLYSTEFRTECHTDELLFQRCGEETVIPQPVRELVEGEPVIQTIVDSQLHFGEIVQTRQEKALRLSVNVVLELLYLDQEEHLHQLTQEIPVSCQLNCVPEDRCDCSYSCPDDVYASPSAGGAEVRFNVEFHCRVTHTTKVNGVTSAQIGKERNIEGRERPSVVLRLASGDETLWDIAKSYGTTEERIAEVNDLEEGLSPAGIMLLIPSHP